MTGFDARRWRAAIVPAWVRWALVAAWVAGVVLATVTDTAPCSAGDPLACSTSTYEAVTFGLALATPVLLVALPAVGCVAGLLFGIDEVLNDTLWTAALAFGVHGTACLAVLAWMLRMRERQARLLPAERAPAGLGPLPLHSPGRLLLAGALLFAGLAALVFYGREKAALDDHLAAATREPARVTAVDEVDWHVTVRLATGEEVRLDTIDPGAYRTDTDQPVRVDRTTRPPWVTLVAEPPDPTLPLSLGVLTLLLAAAAAARDVARRRAWRRLAADPVRAVPVLARPHGDEVLLWPPGGRGRPFARIVTGPIDEEPDEFDEDVEEEFEDVDDALAAEAWEGLGEDWRSGDRPVFERLLGAVPATAYGELRVGGWVAVRTADETWWPRATVRPARRRPDPEEPDDLDEIHRELFPGEPVPAGAVPELPVVLRPPLHRRLLGALQACAYVAGPAAAVTLAENWWQALLAVVVGGQVGVDGVQRLTTGLRLERSALVVRGAWLVHTVPWSAVHGARRDGDTLFLAWTPDTVVPVGPFAAGPGETEDDVVRHTGEAVGALRERALAAGDPGLVPHGRWSVAAWTVPAYGIALLLLLVVQ